MKIQNFAVISGKNVSIKDGKILINVDKNTIENTTKENTESTIEQRAIIRSDTKFSNGKLKFKFKTKKAKLGIQLRVKQTDETYWYIGHSFDREDFIICPGGTNGFSSNTGAHGGSLSNYDLTQPHEMCIEIDGSIVRLYIDNVLIISNNIEVKESNVELKIVVNDDFECYDFIVENKSKQAFIVMQFTQEYNELYEEVIKPVCEEFQIDTIRADEYCSSTPIIEDIISSIRESSLIIADITPDNPNVFYEIGYSHAINKPVILLADKKREKLPFDVSGFRTIFYENTIAGKNKVEQSLRKYLEKLK